MPRLFLAGATGVIAAPMIPLLLRAGFEVAGMTRSPEKAGRLEAQGVRPVVCDVFDHAALIDAVRDFRPDVVMHQLTDLPDDPERLSGFFAANARIRTEGTRNLVEAARAAGAGRLLAQSVAWELQGAGGEAVAEHERLVLGFGGVVARYGRFYGTGTYHEHDRPEPPMVHVAAAAERTVALIDAPSGVVVVAD